MASELNWGTSQAEAVLRQLKTILKTPVLPNRESDSVRFGFSGEPGGDDWDVIHHLRRNEAVKVGQSDRLRCRYGQPQILLQDINPLALMMCFEDLSSGRLRKRLTAAQGELSELTSGAQWTLNNASLSSPIPPALEFPAFISTINQLREKQLITTEQREPTRIYIVDASSHLRARLTNKVQAARKPDGEIFPVPPPVPIPGRKYAAQAKSPVSDLMAGVLSSWSPGAGKLSSSGPST
jgi:hypothetical protein